jgi:VanZ family protein
MAIIMWFSGGMWSASQTGGTMGALLAWLLPTATPAQLAALHGLARTTAHVTEYGILALLWRRAVLRSGRAAPVARWTALGACIAWALVDESRQSTIPTRTGSGWDVLIDAMGATVALAIAPRDWRPIADAVTSVALWVAAVGGALALAVNALAGVNSFALWLTTPAAAALLVWHRRRGIRRGHAA